MPSSPSPAAPTRPSPAAPATGTSTRSPTTNFTVSPAPTAPSGQTVSLSGGPWYSSPSVPLVLANGSDSGAGVDPTSGIVLRAQATLTGGACGTFGAFSQVTLAGSADTSVTSGNCYRYEYRISDLVGNQSAVSAASADAKVDTSTP